MPREEFKQEVVRHLTGQESEPHEILRVGISQSDAGVRNEEWNKRNRFRRESRDYAGRRRKTSSRSTDLATTDDGSSVGDAQTTSE